jgi:hypothetical protein
MKIEFLSPARAELTVFTRLGKIPCLLLRSCTWQGAGIMEVTPRKQGIVRCGVNLGTSSQIS